MQVKMLMRNSCGVIDVSEPLAVARMRLASDPGACLVVMEQGRLAGVLTDADVRAAGASSVPPVSDYEWPQLTARLTVAHAMRAHPVVVGTGAAVTTVARALRARGERVAVVMEGVDVVGVVHARDVLGALADRLQRDGRGALARLLVAVSPRVLACSDVGLRTPLAVACGLARWHVASLTVVHVMRGLSRRVAEGLPAGVEGDLHRWRRSRRAPRCRGSSPTSGACASTCARVTSRKPSWTARARRAPSCWCWAGAGTPCSSAR